MTSAFSNFEFTFELPAGQTAIGTGPSEPMKDVLPDDAEHSSSSSRASEESSDDEEGPEDGEAEHSSSSSPSMDVSANDARLRESELEFELLNPIASNSSNPINERTHDFLTAPLMTRGALVETGVEKNAQYGVLGQVLAVHHKDSSNTPDDARLYLNTNAPLSALVCGVQGSGKSHTVSAMLENMLIPGDYRIGSLSPNRSAWIGTPKDVSTEVPRVNVFVSPSSLNTMRAVYKPLGENVVVQPLYFTDDELDAEAFLSMMGVGSSESAPLYVQIILSILREMGEEYSYQGFRAILNEKRKTFNPAQEAGVKQRMGLLESFMSKVRSRKSLTKQFKAGQMTIIDLSDPFIDSASACEIFEVVTRLFVRTKVETGKFILVDEAHKYLSANNGAAGLTKALLTLIREQRHKGMRVIISTQEPTVVPPVLIDLCTVTILHRFSSPSWWEHVVKHVSADVSATAFDLVVKLKTGEAIVLAPSGLCIDGSGSAGQREIGHYGRRYLHVRVRRRITEDGGGSVLVVQ